MHRLQSLETRRSAKKKIIKVDPRIILIKDLVYQTKEQLNSMMQGEKRGNHVLGLVWFMERELR